MMINVSTGQISNLIFQAKIFMIKYLQEYNQGNEWQMGGEREHRIQQAIRTEIRE